MAGTSSSESSDFPPVPFEPPPQSTSSGVTEAGAGGNTRAAPVPSTLANTGNRFSDTVAGALADMGSEDVLPAALIDRILERHAGDYLPRSLARAAWAQRDQREERATGVRQPSAQWQVELERLVRPSQKVFGRLAIVALALADQAVAQSAQLTGLLEAQLAEIRAGGIDLLSDFGISMLRKRAPIVAFGHGVYEPTLSLRDPAPANSTVITLAAQGGVPNDEIGQWAHSNGASTYVGMGGASGPVDGLARPTALGWDASGELLAFVNDTEGGEVLRVQVSDGTVTTLPHMAENTWPSARAVVIGAGGTAMASTAGELDLG